MGDQALSRVHAELRCVLDELKRCGGPGVTPGAEAALLRLRAAADAAAPQQLLFPAGALRELAGIMERQDAGSNVSASSLYAIAALVNHKGATQAQMQLLRQSKLALRCAHADPARTLYQISRAISTRRMSTRLPGALPSVHVPAIMW